LQELIPVTPYDEYLQQQPAQDAGQQAAPVHIQTEEDLQLPQQQQQQQVDTGVTQQQQQQQQQQHDQPPTPGKPGFVGRLSSQRLPLSSFSRSKASTAKSSIPVIGKRSQGAAGVRQTLLHDAENLQQLVKVQLLVLTPVDAAEAAAVGAQPQVVQLLLQVQSPGDSQPATPSKANAGSSSSKLLGAGADAVKGLLQGLQHSAAAGLHQSAAAGQELTDAVAAAGEAVMGAMITQPFAAVKGFAARAGGSKQGPAAASIDTTGSSTAATAQQGGTPDSNSAAAAATSSRRLASLFSKRHGSAAAPVADTEGMDKQDPAAAAAVAAVHAGGLQGDGPLLHVQLLISPEPSSSSPVRLVITPLGAAAAPEASSVSRATSSSSPSWHSRKGLLGKFKRGSSKDSAGSQHKGSSSPRATAAAAAAETGDAKETGGADDVLEGDMWSVMTRLKQGGAGKPAKHGAATAASSTAAAAQQQQQQQQEGLQLLQQLLDSCEQVQLAAAASKGSIGDECEPLLLLVALTQEALNHGLCNTQAAAAAAAAAARDEDGSASSKAAAAARDVLGGWLPRHDVTAFGVGVCSRSQIYCSTRGCSKQERRLLIRHATTTSRPRRLASVQLCCSRQQCAFTAVFHMLLISGDELVHRQQHITAICLFCCVALRRSCKRCSMAASSTRASCLALMASLA
jgi:hypothetical protein